LPARLARPTVVAVLASVVAATLALPGWTPAVQARDGQTFVQLVNDYRDRSDVPPVRLHDVIDRIAIQRADQLAAARQLGHDLAYVEERLDANGVCWQQLGEIVAYNGRPADERVARFVYQWHTSDGHRAIMLGEGYTHAGGSWTTGSDGYHYAAMIFVRLCSASPARSTATPFTDIAGTPWERTITWVYKQGIMSGCRSTRFCPRGDLTRGALAQALADGLDLAATNRDYFADDEGSRFEDGINRLAAAGLARGCGDGNYCPSRPVRRGALATAIATALRLPRSRVDYFRDDERSPHEANINRIAAAGITGGCGGGRFCPTHEVGRGHATVFLRRAFD
jgi:uncharacterized protein YkwD